MIINKRVRWIVVPVIVLFLMGKYFSIPDKSLEELKPIYAGKTSKFMDLDGRKIHYRDEGEGEVIVLIHGTGASLHTWDAWAENLRKTYRVIRLDLPAYGLTGSDPKKRYTSKDYVDVLDEFLTQLSIDKFILAGNSLGGLVSWLYASHHPKKVDQLILVDPSGFPFDSTPLVIQLAKTPLLNLFIRHITPKSFIEKNLKEVYYDDSRITQKTIDRYYNLTLYEGNRQAFIDRAYIEREDYTDRLSRINVPTLLLWGEKDEWIPVTDAAKFQAVLPQSKVVILPETGHVPMEERPIKSLNEVLRFIAD